MLIHVQVKGIKGASVLASHKHFDLSKGAVIYVMHCVFLGVIERNLLSFLFDIKHRSAPYSIRRKVNKLYTCTCRRL